MKKANILKNPTRVSDLMSFDDLYEEISNNLDLKIERLQARRRAKLERDLS